MNRIEREVTALKGATITDAMLIGDVPVLIVRTTKGQTFQVEVWCDPEGNGAGFLSIGGEVKGGGR